MEQSEAIILDQEQRGGVYLASASVYPELADEIALAMGTAVGPMEHKQFENTEVYSRYLESVRGKHVVLIHPLSAEPGWSVNDGFMQLVFMASAARGASAKEITAVVPNLAYARQDRKSKGREPVSAQTVLDILAVSGVNRVVTVDPHSPQIQLAFHGPLDQLIAAPILQDALTEEILGHDADYLVIAPDAGRLKQAEHYGENLTDMTSAIKEGRFIGSDSMGKRRMPDGRIVHQLPKTDVRGKNLIVVDDMIDTAKTLVSAVAALDEAGANRIVVVATHGIFSGAALNRIAGSAIKQVIVTDTLPMDKADEALRTAPDEEARLRILPIAPIIGRALVEIVTYGSVSKWFKGYEQFS